MTMGTDSAVTVRGLRKVYNDQPAVDGIDLDIKAGEILALLGPNGAGKSTTVEILEGFRKRDAGMVTVLGKDPDNSKRDGKWRARVGIVAQSAGSVPELTVTEIVRHFATFYPRSKDPDEVITRTGLDEKRNKRVGTLSGGQQRRLDVALAIIGNPDLLFLDEPTTGFDPAARRQFWHLIEDLNADGTTILLTTHYLEEAEALAKRIAVISAGKIVAEGTPGALGGRDMASARLSWEIPGTGRRTMTTATPTQAVRKLARELAPVLTDAVGVVTGVEGEIPGLTVTRPTLEDVYLELIGGKE
jgi:ABC-2 type transport system ATP-binding protein